MKNKLIAIIIIIAAVVFCGIFADFDSRNNTVEIGEQEIVLK